MSNPSFPRNKTDLEKAKLGVLTYVRAHESLRREDGSLFNDPAKNPSTTTEILNNLSRQRIAAYHGFVEQASGQTMGQLNELQVDTLNPYPTDKALTQKALGSLVSDGLLERQTLGRSAVYRLTQAGKEYVLPSITISKSGDSVFISPRYSSDDVQNALGAVLGKGDPKIAEVIRQLVGSDDKAKSIS